MVRAFEPGLKDELGRNSIEQRLGGFAIAPGFAQARFGIERGQAFVGKGDGYIKAAFQPFDSARITASG